MKSDIARVAYCKTCNVPLSGIDVDVRSFYSALTGQTTKYVLAVFDEAAVDSMHDGHEYELREYTLPR